MKIQVTTQPIATLSADALILGCFESEALSEKALTALASDFPGELNETLTLYPKAFASKRVILVGLGPRGEFDVDKLRQAAAAGAQAARELKLSAIAMAFETDLPAYDAAFALTEGAILGLYEDLELKTDTSDRTTVTTLSVVSRDEADAKRAIQKASAICQSVNWVRDLVNRPSNRLTATMLADEATRMAKDRGISCRVLGKSELERQGFGCLLGVNQGSTEPPAFIILEYKGGKRGEKPIALVGKGVTFDTGGLCIKPGEGMEEMKTDMAGAASVLGTIRALAGLKAPINVVGLVCATDNSVSGRALKPGDILKSYKGLYVEVVDTDAEGRLILADGLAFADKNYDPAFVIDLATLTGSVIIALGNEVTGIFGRDEALLERVRRSGEATGERCWPLPTWDEYEDFVESDIADIKNSDPRRGDAIAAAMFLKRFAGDRPWVHMDIAGPSWAEDSPKPYIPKGATGMGVRLLVHMLTSSGDA